VFRQKRFAAVLAALLVLPGCVSSSPESSSSTAESEAQDGGHFADSSIFTDGFGRIKDVSLVKEDFGKLTLDGLKGLSKLDDTLTARRDGDHVQLVRSGHVIADFEAPGPDAAYDWGYLVSSSLDAAALASPKVAGAGVEAVYQQVYDSLLADFDPYSRYLNPDRAREDRARRDGYDGVGIALMQDDKGRPVIADVFPDTPAAHANMLKGSLIVAVDGVSVTDAKVDEVVTLMRGVAKTKVDLTVIEPNGRGRAVTLTREHVIENTARAQVRDNVVIIQLSRFNSTSAADVRTALTGQLHGLAGRARGVILDLRGNPGGPLDQSVTLAGLFMDRGPIISTRGRSSDSDRSYSAPGEDITNHLPLAVLVDGHSASAAEVTAAALQDSNRAILVGSTSFGKGSVQTVSSLRNDAELLLTWSRIYAPSGYTWHRQGILPNVCTSNGNMTDPKAVIQAFSAGQLPRPADFAADRRAAPDDEAALRRIRAVCPWQVHDDDLDVSVALDLIGDAGLYAQALGDREPHAVVARTP
jgi:carboxyl-terminal processing protease